MSKAKDLAGLVSTGGILADGTVNLASEVTGTLPVTSGGTGGTTAADARTALSAQEYDSNLTSFVSTFTLPTTDGSADQVLKTNGSGVIGFGTVGGSTYQATLTGTLVDGAPVVVNSDGTISPVIGSAAVTFNSATPTAIHGTYISNGNKILVTYANPSNSSYGSAVVGTINGYGITYGTPVVFYTGTMYQSVAVYDSVNDKVIIYYSRSSDRYAFAIAGSISGSSITFGSAISLTSFDTQTPNAAYHTAQGKAVFAFRNNSTGQGQYIVVSITSGTTLSAGSIGTITGTSCYTLSSVYHAASETVVFFTRYSPTSSNGAGNSFVGTLSGTTFSFGAETGFASNVQWGNMAYDSTNTKIIVTWADGANSNYGTARVATLSGSALTFGTNVVYESSAGSGIAVHNPTTQKTAILYTDANNSNYATIILGTVSGTGINFGTSLSFDNTNSGIQTAFYSSGTSSIGVIYTSDSGVNGKAFLFTSGDGTANLTVGNYIGISNGAYTDGQTATVQIAGSVDDAQSGLTPGVKYYLSSTGTLTSDSSGLGIVAGTAVTSTKLIVKG